MARLPNVGGDDGNWGTILNDFLSVSLDNTNVDEGERGKLIPAAVDAAGAVMNSDTSTASMSFVVDEDDMSSNSATKVPTQQSVKAYIDSGSATLSNKTLTSPVINTSVSGTAIVDEDDMISNSATKIPTQQSVKAYFDNNLTSSSINKAFSLKYDGFSAIRTAINDSKNTAYDLVILADSIPMQTFNAPGWTWQLGDKFARAAGQCNPTKEVYYARPFFNSTIGHYKMDYCEGTDNLNVTARGGATLANGNVAYHTAVCDGWTVGYTAGTGSLQIRDGGPGGTLLTTINTSLVTGSGNLWTSSALTYQSNQIHITSVGDTVLDFVRPYVGNRTTGVRVWTVSRTGIRSDQFSSVPAYGLNFINKLQPDFVLICTGTNDTGSSPVATLINDVLTNAPSTTVYGWVPPVGAAFTQSEADAIRSAYTSAGVAKIEMDKLLPDWELELTRDGVHPYASTTRLMADLVWGVLTGDKEAEKMRSGIDNFVNSLDITGTYNRDIRLLSARQASEEGFTGKPTIQLNDGASNTVTLSATSTTLNVTGAATVSSTLTASANAVINGTISGTAIVNENAMTSNSSTKVPTQSSVKAYADTKAPIASPTFTGTVTLPDSFTYSSGNLSGSNFFGSPLLQMKDTGNSSPQIQLVTAATNGALGNPAQPAIAFGPGSSVTDTTIHRNSSASLTINNGAGDLVAARKFTTNTSTSYTLVLADQSRTIECNNASAQTVTVPPNSSVAFPIGSVIFVTQYGAGQVTIAPGSGVTLRALDSILSTNGQYGSLMLHKRATDEWIVTSISNLVVDTDTTLTANSDSKIPSQKAVKTYVDTTSATSSSIVVQSKNSNYSVVATDDVILVDATSGNVTIDVITAVGRTRPLSIKKVDSSVNTVIVDAAGSETIDGGATAVLTSQYESITLVSNNSNYFIT